ncbi:MAG: A24 family peptidase [Oscillospiraceae bacterium]|nr:A24 family peptidase [Oscillospiraceae bacterium]
MKMIITAAAAAVLSAAGFTVLKDIPGEEKMKGSRRFWFAVSLAVYLAADMLTVHASEEYGIINAVSMLFAVNFIFLLGVIDIRHRKIPNIYAAGAAAARTLFILVQGLCEGRTAELFAHSLAGLAAGGFITGLVYVISGRGIGAGDVKMFAVIGYFTGGFAMMDILVYSTVFCCVCGIFLLIFRKCSHRDCIPMAPFAYAGTMLYVLSGM